MQRYFSHKCDGTDVHADWKSCTYGRAPNAIDILQGSWDKPFYMVIPIHRPFSRQKG